MTRCGRRPSWLCGGLEKTHSQTAPGHRTPPVEGATRYRAPQRLMPVEVGGAWGAVSTRAHQRGDLAMPPRRPRLGILRRHRLDPVDDRRGPRPVHRVPVTETG